MADPTWQSGIVRAMETGSDFAWSWGSSKHAKFAFRLEDWKFLEKIKNLPPPDELNANAIHQFSRDYQKVESMVHLSKALLASASDLFSIYSQRFEALAAKLSKGFGSLPDELLALVLKFAASHKQDETKYALWLSHVSRRFRRLAIEDQTLWTTLCMRPYTTKDNLTRFISRSGEDLDLRIVIDLNEEISASTLHEFVKSCSVGSHRWQSLMLTCHWDGYKFEDTSIHKKLLLLMESHRLVLPRLHELCLIENREETFDDRYPVWESSTATASFDDVHPWEAPNLHCVRCNGCIPPPSFPFGTIKRFTLSLSLFADYISTQVGDLVKFLGSNPSIIGVALTFDDFDGVACEEEMEAVQVATVDCPAITCLRINATIFAVEAFAKVIGPLVKALQMPQLHNFFLAVDIQNQFGYLDPDRLRPALGEVVPDLNHNPLFRSFVVNIRFREKDFPPGSRDGKSMAIDIPLNKIPQVIYLCVTAPGWISFSHPSDTGGVVVPGSLRHLEIRSCRKMAIEGLRFAVELLKDINAWDMLESVTIRNCTLLDYNMALDVIGREKLRFVGGH